MNWRYLREKRLLRIAPWADIPLLREKVIEAAQAVLDKWIADENVGMAADYRNIFDEFLEDKRPTLPDLYDFQVAAQDAIYIVHKQYADDERWNVACSELERYFFKRMYWTE